MRTESVILFTLSLFVSVLALCVERLIGIDWDFHPDAVTYVNTSSSIANAVLSDWTLLPNKLYYVIVDLFCGNVSVLILINMMFFAATNVLLWRCHVKLVEHKFKIERGLSIFLFALIVLNPYRVHLSTALLKDTVILFFVIAMFFPKGVLPAIFLMLLRVASAIYLIMRIPRRYLGAVVVIMLCAFLLDYDYVVNHLEFMHNTDMQFREFDQVSSFSEFGSAGIVIRAIVWPILALTGIFALFSPSFEMILLALGSMFSFAYLMIFFGWKFTVGNLLAPFLCLLIFALLVSGFTSYIRYVYPILTSLPIFLYLRLVNTNK